uniref:Reversion-inducing cysteine-rich protein with Kazal motifs n=2 Tax=Cacopsylla melanoneura TaxID=428564 RepID=A0A8D9A166_9HEMI
MFRLRSSNFLVFIRTCIFNFYIYFVLLFISQVASVNLKELNCCTKSSGSCRKACEQLPLVTLALNSTLREQRISELKTYCPPQLMSFWKCLNETVQEINKGESWSGRACCQMTLSERCQFSCITATSKQDLQHFCRQSDELDFFTCSSECAAIAASVAVDYRGYCAALGYIGAPGEVQCRSDAIQCPAPVSPHCMGVTPPGACCPICAGALRILYSQKQVDRALYALRGSAMSALSVHVVLKALERQVQTAQCSVRGHLTLELDLLVLLVPTSNEPSTVQLEACLQEAEKLAALITNTSPRIVSELSLSPLIAAQVVHTQVASSAHTVLVGSASVTLLALILLLRFN